MVSWTSSCRKALSTRRCIETSSPATCGTSSFRRKALSTRRCIETATPSTSPRSSSRRKALSTRRCIETPSPRSFCATSTSSSESAELQTVHWPPPDGTRADFCDVGQKGGAPQRLEAHPLLIEGTRSSRRPKAQAISAWTPAPRAPPPFGGPRSARSGAARPSRQSRGPR